MRSFKILKHDTYANELIQLLQTPALTIQQNLVLYSHKGRMVAEIDIFIERKHSIQIIEVKCSFRLKKAKRQLQKIKKILAPQFEKPIELYFYNGSSKELVSVMA